MPLHVYLIVWLSGPLAWLVFFAIEWWRATRVIKQLEARHRPPE